MNFSRFSATQKVLAYWYLSQYPLIYPVFTVGQSYPQVNLQAQLLRAFGVHEPPSNLSDGYGKLFGALSGLFAARTGLLASSIWPMQQDETR